MSDFSERVNFTIDYIGDKLNQKAWGEDQIKEFLEIRISEFKAEFKECEKVINRIERLKSEGKINSSNFDEYEDDEKSFRLKMRSLSDDIYFLKMLKLETPDTINKMRSLKSDKLIQPIHWLKGEESLRQFLDTIKSAGLIENRETNEIIKEHFYVDGREPIKEPQPIKWLIESQYLAYLMHRLAEEFIINIKGRKHELTASHFVSGEGKTLKSLASQLSQILKHGRSSNENISSIENIIQKIKS